MKKIYTLLFILGTVSLSIAQKETDKWFFGSGAALDFSSGTPVVITSPMYTSEGTAAVSDAAGKLRFFTNGVDVYDSTKTIMLNGAGLMGDISTTQSAIIVPNPASSSQYYIFTAGADGAGDFRYSIVDMTLNGGLGDVMVANKNILLTDSITEKIAAIRDGANGIWIVTHKWGTDQFYSYHLTTSGLMPPVITGVGEIHNTGVIQNSYGQLKFNNCGTRLVCAIGYQDIVELFDFNLTTGVVSNPMAINMGDNVYGVEFSPSGNFLYATSYFTSCKLAQFDISLATLPLILASKVPLSATDDLYGLQLGPDGKIYVSRSFSSQYLGVISNPEVSGFGCNYSDTGLDLDPSFMGVNGALSLPSFMQTYLKLALGVTCLTTEISETNSEVFNPVYPNPTSSEFTINLTNKDALVSIYNCTGKLIAQHQNVNSDFSFGKEYAKGIYFVHVKVGEQANVFKVVKT
ncbi:MAG TPA: T9SS type A sorting domain-containing protein [Bacteroidia bacterium]|nr:T9SS type A sorting domain-containing protein [Bacteroidia bacterium]